MDHPLLSNFRLAVLYYIDTTLVRHSELFQIFKYTEIIRLQFLKSISQF